VPRVTAVKKQSRNPGRVNIYLDNKFAFGLSQELAAKFGLLVGREISGEQILLVKKGSCREKSLTMAYRYLSYRPRSEREVKDYLVRKGIGGEEIKSVIFYLEEQGYLNDNDFARWWLEQRNQFRPRGCRLLRQELIQKGISQEIIDRVLAGVDEKELIGKLLRKRHLRSWGESDRGREKLVAYLGRRGFSWPVILEVLESLKGPKKTFD
jgi:regulatory protein